MESSHPCRRFAEHVGRTVDAHIPSESLGIEPPTFDEAPCVTTFTVASLPALLVTMMLTVALRSGSTGASLLGVETALAIVAGALAWTGPEIVTTFKRRSAAGAAPELVAYAVLQARLTPSLERAAAFAADGTGGRLGAHLERAAARGATGRDVWRSLAADWADVDPTLPRAVELLAAGVESSPPARERLLDRALETVLEGSRERVATFAAEVRAPATGVYAFGVMLPLATVGLLPVAASAGAGVSPATIAVLYDGVVPLGLVVASGWLALKRPAVSSPPTSTSALESPRNPRTTVSIGAAAGVAAFVVARLAAPPWTAWIVAPGMALGAAAVYHFEPVRERRERVAAIESGLPDAVALVGHRLAANEPLETAVGSVGDRLTGETAAVFEDAAAAARRVRVTVAESFGPPVGPLADVESPRTETAVALLVAAARNGPDGGRTLVRVAEYLRELDRVEREARRDLARTTDTLRQTATVFGPAIAGVTVALATGVGPLGDAGAAVPVDALGIAVGGYVLALSVVLPTLAVVLERGPDLATVAYRVGVASLVASAVYPITVVAATAVVQV